MYLNCLSRQGYRYFLLLTGVATKMIWEFLLKERSGENVLECIQLWCEQMLVKYPGEHTLKHFHTDGGKELIDQRVRSYLLNKFGTHIT